MDQRPSHRRRPYRRAAARGGSHGAAADLHNAALAALIDAGDALAEELAEVVATLEDGGDGDEADMERHLVARWETARQALTGTQGKLFEEAV